MRYSDTITVLQNGGIGGSGVETDSATSWWRAELTPTSPNFAAATVWKGTVNLDASRGPRLVPTYPTPITPTYDADGNLTYDGRNYYVWDSLGRLTAALVPGQHGYPQLQITFVYDAMGRRIGKSVSGQPTNASVEQDLFTEVYLYDTWNDGWNPIATYRLVGASSHVDLYQTYTWGLDLSGTMLGAGGVGGLLVATSYEDYVSPNSWETNTIRPVPRFPAYDGNGNVMALINAKTVPPSDGGAGMTAGSIDAAYEYDPFGKNLRATGPAAASNPFRFSTKFTDDETGLCYYGYRYYDPVLGRWLSRDPIAETGGVNLYGMCGNDAVGKWDYLGLDERTLVLAMGPDIGEGLAISEQNPSASTKPIIPILRQQLGYLPSSVNYSKSKPIRDKAFIEARVQARLAKYSEAGWTPEHTGKFLFTYTATTAEVQSHLASKGDRYIVMAHGKHAPTETGLVFEVPGALVLNTSIAAPYPLSSVLSEDFKPIDNKLAIACCYPGKLPSKVRKVELVKLVGSPSSDTTQMAGPSVEKIVDVWMCLLEMKEAKQ